ncbi:monofunctional biosynthetic peptidoglycan transglycosylase [Marilutibacter chinensis]|uniref:Biosynthetic peptidoglycan transglycosylase n=1 Tax=Marilutibacter chinensis TaxID=2912247 RepID=A0ABS9HWW3_9GAMM|nr:monofunctional biosynthetic peptidoglycan transglycosylase [Lysobacter chinensis]
MAGGTRQHRRSRLRRLVRWLLALPVLALLASVLQVGVLRFVDPPFSAFMLARQFEAWGDGDWSFRVACDWRDLDEISAQLPLAVIASEDQRFPQHRGFDLKAIEKAIESNERGGRMRGGSTISQQTAKNLFLWSGRSWVRKGIEAWYTVLIEAMWPKTRIIEVYVNVAEFGDGVYGAQAAAVRYFGVDAARLSPAQAARLAAVLPSPRRYSAARPGPYVQRRTHAIQRQMRNLGGPAFLETLD